MQLVQKGKKIFFFGFTPTALLVVSSASDKIRWISIHEIIRGKCRCIKISEIATSETAILLLNPIYEIGQFLLHLLVEISFTYGEIEFSVGIKANLIIKGINDYYVKHYVVIIIYCSFCVLLVKIRPEFQELVSVIISKSCATFTVVVVISVFANKRQIVFFNNLINPIHNGLLIKILKGIIQIE